MCRSVSLTRTYPCWDWLITLEVLKAKGFEVEATLVPTANLELSFSYAFNEAELTEDYYRLDSSTADAVDGQDLPFTPDNKYSLTAKYDFNLADKPTTFVLNYAFTDEMYNDIFSQRAGKMDSYA